MSLGPHQEDEGRGTEHKGWTTPSRAAWGPQGPWGSFHQGTEQGDSQPEGQRGTQSRKLQERNNMGEAGKKRGVGLDCLRLGTEREK